jgi:ABC-2 type transport system permease protein
VDARTQTAELIDELGLGEYADRHVNNLSGGMMRLVNFGMSLMGRPALLVLDEPTNELDPRNRRLVWDAVSRRSAGEGTTVVLVTHNVLEAERAVDRVAIMHQGRITAIGTPGELKERMDDRTRMELVVRGGGELTAGELRQLAVVGEVVPGGREGSYLVHSTPSQVPALVQVVTSDIGLTRLDDFRLARPTLEDVYLDLDRGATHREAAVLEAAVEPPAVERAARPPWRERVRRELVSFKYLWLEQMLEVRTTWSWTLLFGFLMPVAMVFGLTRIGDGLSDPKSLLYIASGAAVFSVATEGIGTLAQRVGVLKRDGMMVYYASLPISRAALLASMVSARLVLVLPGLVTPILAANVLYDAGFQVSPALLVVLPLTCLALSAVGLAIGMLIDNIELIVVITNLLIFVLLLAAPVLIPPESLPTPLRLISYLLPPTYAADALRGALTGDLGGSFPLDLCALVAMAVLGLLAATRWIRWRTA